MISSYDDDDDRLTHWVPFNIVRKKERKKEGKTFLTEMFGMKKSKLRWINDDDDVVVLSAFAESHR